MAVSPRGDIAVIWTGCPRTEPCEGRQDVLVAVLPVGANRFEAPFRPLAHFDEEVPSWTPQFNARGDLVIAYVGDNGRVDLRVRRAGTDFGPQRTLGRQDGETSPQVAFDDRGRIAVLWTTQDGGEETELPLRVQAVVGSAFTGKLRDVQVLDPGPPPGGDYGSYGVSGLAIDSGMRASLDPSGRATAIWGQVTGVFASTSDRDGAFKPPTRITPARDPSWDMATAPEWPRTHRVGLEARDLRPRAARRCASVRPGGARVAGAAAP